MTILERTKEFFNMAKKGMLILSNRDMLAFVIQKENINFDKEKICELLEDWLYENEYDCMVLCEDINCFNKPITSIGVDCLDYLDDVMDRRKIRILTEMFLDKQKIKYKN